MTAALTGLRPTTYEQTMLPVRPPSCLRIQRDHTQLRDEAAETVRATIAMLVDAAGTAVGARPAESLSSALSLIVPARSSSFVVDVPSWLSSSAQMLSELNDISGSALDIVDELVMRTKLPATSICKAAGISRRTYQSWRKKPDTSPRLHSQGRLWLLVQCLEDVAEVTGSFGWVANYGYRDQLEEGNFDGVLESAVSAVRLPRIDVPGHGDIGDDRVLHEPKVPVPPGRSRRL